MVMKRGSNLTWRLATIGMAAVAMVAAGCHHKSADDFLAEGDAAMQTTKLPEAEAAYLQAIKAAPNDPRTHIALGNLYVFEHKPGQAQIEFSKVLESDPKNAATHVALGNLFIDQSQLGQAENQFRAAVILEPDRPNHHLELAEVLRKQGKLMEAEAELRAAVGLAPRNAQAHLALGNLLTAEAGRNLEANVEFDQVRALDPKLLPAAVAAVPNAPSPMTAAAPKIKPLNKLFLLTKNSSVYESPDVSSHAVGQVRRKKYVHVTGISGEFLQIKMKNGTVGFIPVSAAE
jgi:tetratricopeptide (TPR) repeat protein